MMRHLMIGLALIFCDLDGNAMFVRSQTQEVPMARLFTNLQQRLNQDTNNFELTYDLARLHSMAYSTTAETIQVTTNTGRPTFYYPGSDSGVPQDVSVPRSAEARSQALTHLTNALVLFDRAIQLLKKSTNQIQSGEWLVLPLELGRAWCLDQAGSRADALKAYRKTFVLAWKREVTGEFKLKEWLEGTWDAVKSGNNPLHVTTRPSYLGPGVCYSQELIGYLLKLLDPVADAKEIADLKAKQKILAAMGRAVTPILVPLESALTLADLVNPQAGVAFDLDGSGLPRRWSWITPKAAWLVFDNAGQGKITSGLQMFGNVTFWIFWRDGYDALRALDDNHDGVLSGTELRGLALWQDRNANGICEPGEVRSVSHWGISAISCAGEPQPGTTLRWCPNGVTFDNREMRPSYDWIAPSQPARNE